MLANSVMGTVSVVKHSVMESRLSLYSSAAIPQWLILAVDISESNSNKHHDYQVE